MPGIGSSKPGSPRRFLSGGNAKATGLAPARAGPGPTSIAWIMAMVPALPRKRMAITPCCGRMSLKTRSTALPSPPAVAAMSMSVATGLPLISMLVA